VDSEIIERFFQKKCTAEEAKNVFAFLKANPSVLEKYVSAEEWNSLIENYAMPEEFWNEVWFNIQKKNRSKIISLKFKRITAAACFILLAGTVYYYINSEKENNKQLAEAPQHISPQTQLKTVLNNTKKLVTVILSDSSVITLSPASSVQYDDAFPNDKRDIVLEGEAEFHVTKNKKKPFTVYAGTLATTALGTIFSVKETGKKNIITVKLFQGKVVVHSTDNNLKGWDKGVYLLPGEQLKFKEGSNMLAVEKIDDSSKTTVAIKPKKLNTKADSISNQLTFSNTLLPEVLNKLSAYYKVKIQYDTLLINKMNFTGSILKNDSLPVILKAIAQMNDLEILKQDDGFIIFKPEQ
jgi:ferric-dicitrate binding protein FerR (iron transport regulator)